jgi:hypothetical protein
MLIPNNITESRIPEFLHPNAEFSAKSVQCNNFSTVGHRQTISMDHLNKTGSENPVLKLVPFYQAP